MKTYRVKQVSSPPDLNGKPVGEVWNDAESVPLVTCVTGQQPQLSTQVKLLWDQDYLYLGYLVEDNTIIATYSQRDEPLWKEDVVEVFLSPSGSEHYYYEFNFSPREVVLDIIVLNDGGRAGEGRGDLIPFTTWDAKGLKLATRIQADQNWFVTVAIPFRDLHFAGNRPPDPGDHWRANLCRIEYGGEKPEYSTWNPTGLVDFHTSEKFGTLVFEE